MPTTQANTASPSTVANIAIGLLLISSVVSENAAPAFNKILSESTPTTENMLMEGFSSVIAACADAIANGQANLPAEAINQAAPSVATCVYSHLLRVTGVAFLVTVELLESGVAPTPDTIKQLVEAVYNRMNLTVDHPLYAYETGSKEHIEAINAAHAVIRSAADLTNQ